MANPMMTSTWSWGPTSRGPTMTPHKGGYLLTWKEFKLKQSVTPFLCTKFDGKTNGNINSEFGGQ